MVNRMCTVVNTVVCQSAVCFRQILGFFALQLTRSVHIQQFGC